MFKKPLRLYEFGPFQVNATERLLERDNEKIPLSPKVFDTLLVLVENKGHVVTKDDLMQALWPDSFVEESSLTQNISLIRRALGQSSDGQPYIETLPKRGYRFVAEVVERIDSTTEVLMHERTTTSVVIEEHDDGIDESISSRAMTAISTPSPRRRPMPRFAAPVLALGTISLLAFVVIAVRIRRGADSFVPRTVAVLPFRIIGEQTEPEQLSLGMADALVIRLSKLDKPIILPTSSVARFTRRDQDPLAIGKELGVDGIIDGTLQRDGDRVRVSTQFIRLSDGKTIWSGNFDEEFHTSFALQDSISNRVAQALVEQIAKNSKQKLTTHLTENSEAYQAYVTGIYFWNRRTKEDLTKAIFHLDEAVRKDDNFALAHAILADCYYLSADANYDILPRRDEIIRADSETKKALALDDEIAEAHTVKAGLLMFYADRPGADKEFQRALELKPGYSTGHLRYGYFLFNGGDLKGALEQMERAQELDPASPTSNAALGYISGMARDDEKSLNCYRRALELQPDFHFFHFNLAELLVRKHRFDDALSELDKFKDAPPMDLLMEKIYVYGVMGRKDEASRLLAQLQTADISKLRPFDWAILYAAVGDRDSAFDWLDKIKQVGFFRARLLYDPQLDPLRNDNRFAEFMARNQNVPNSNTAAG